MRVVGTAGSGVLARHIEACVKRYSILVYLMYSSAYTLYTLAPNCFSLSLKSCALPSNALAWCFEFQSFR